MNKWLLSLLTPTYIYMYVHSALMICAWTNGYAHNRDAGDLRRHRAHYDVTVMHVIHVYSDNSTTLKYAFIWVLLLLIGFTELVTGSADVVTKSTLDLIADIAPEKWLHGSKYHTQTGETGLSSLFVQNFDDVQFLDKNEIIWELAFHRNTPRT